MNKEILVFNVGSSSIKYSLFENSNFIKYGYYDRLKSKEDYEKAVKEIFKELANIKIDIIAHRVVHGGDLRKTSKVTKEVKNKIKEFSQFAPLHNPKQLMIIEECEKLEKNKPQYVVFDTLFFSNLPDITKTYPIPKELTKKYNIKRYGFHGLSDMSVSKDLKGKTIVCHLGSGSSITAIKDGKAIDTTMGLTPLEGIMMGTRSGSIDPGIIFFLQKKGHNAEDIITNKSGLKGVGGYEDFRDIREKMDKNKDCKLAYDMFVYQIAKTIGSYAAALNGLDNLVFTGKIGENVSKLREDVCKHLKYIKPNVKFYVRKSNEERIIIEEVLNIIK
jgi:acetate kinase